MSQKNIVNGGSRGIRKKMAAIFTHVRFYNIAYEDLRQTQIL
jgi:hypothetical protein